MKTTLFERLQEICRDQGVQKPKGVDIQRITGLSSGRVTQIKKDGEGSRIGIDAHDRLVRLGYNSDWVRHGRGDKRSCYMTGKAQTVEEDRAVKLRTVRERYIYEIGLLFEQINDHGLAALLEKAKDLSRDYPNKKEQVS